MPQRSAIDVMPADVRAELDAMLAASGFSGYDKHVEWLAARGFTISRSAVHRHGSKVEKKLAAIKASTEAARLIAEVAPDDEDQRSAAVISMMQSGLFDVLTNLQELDEEEDPAARAKVLANVARAVSQLSRASVHIKKFQTEVADRVRAAADAIEKKARQGGLSAETVADIKRDILGIAT